MKSDPYPLMGKHDMIVCGYVTYSSDSSLANHPELSLTRIVSLSNVLWIHILGRY